MVNRIRKVFVAVVAAGTIVVSIAFIALWVSGPFYQLAGIFPLPFANQTIDINAGAGMMHVTFNHDSPPTAWWYIYAARKYPANLRTQHVRTYLSFELPKSNQPNTSFGKKTWLASLQYGNQPRHRHTRFWFPVVVPTIILNTVVLAFLALWRFRRIRSARRQTAIT